MFRYKLVIEYDGTIYNGWQRQKDTNNTIEYKILQAIFKLSQEKVTLVVAGRTDSGVHALEQVAHFDLEKYIKESVITAALNFYLKDETIVIIETEIVDNNFHARFSAKQRCYVYKIYNRKINSPILNNKIWHVKYPLNIELMNNAAKYLLGTHDFSSFRASGCQAKSSIRTIDSIRLYKTEANNDIICMEVKAQSFLYHQIRNFIGTLIKVGARKISVSDFSVILEKRDRKLAFLTAPACGLYLMKIKY